MMKKIALLILFSTVLQQGFSMILAGYSGQFSAFRIQSVVSLLQPNHPHQNANPKPPSEQSSTQKKLQEINEVFEKRIKSVKAGSDNQYITKDRQIQILQEQRDALVKDLLTRRDKQ
ncbi:MAG: hypothetical protein NVS1B13_13260 [Flavisolibacter sp.]